MNTEQELQSMQDYLEIQCQGEGDEIKERMSVLNVYMARSGHMLAQLNKSLRGKKTSEINKTIIAIAKASHLSAKVQNALLDSICEEESFLVEWCERINRSCTHQGDSLRSLLSYEKEQLRLRETGY